MYPSRTWNHRTKKGWTADMAYAWSPGVLVMDENRLVQNQLSRYEFTLQLGEWEEVAVYSQPTELKLKRFTDKQLEDAGFQKRTNINPRPPHRASFGYTNTSVFLHVWESGDKHSKDDGELVFDYPGGNFFVQDYDHLLRLAAVIRYGHREWKDKDPLFCNPNGTLEREKFNNSVVAWKMKIHDIKQKSERQEIYTRIIGMLQLGVDLGIITLEEGDAIESDMTENRY